MGKFLEALEKLSSTVGTALSGPIFPMAVEIGKDLIDLLNKSKEVVKDQDAQHLETLLADLEPKVMAHADKTATMLRGE